MTFLKSPPSTPDAVADEYAATISGSSLPKYRIPEASSDRRAVFDLVRDELFMDSNSRRNAATFCTTYADDEVRRLMDLLIDKDEYAYIHAGRSGTARRGRLTFVFATLWKAPFLRLTASMKLGFSQPAAKAMRQPLHMAINASRNTNLGRIPPIIGRLR